MRTKIRIMQEEKKTLNVQAVLRNHCLDLHVISFKAFLLFSPALYEAAAGCITHSAAVYTTVM